LRFSRYHRLHSSYYFLISFFLAHGIDGQLFLRQLFGTSISAFFATDLLISGVVFLLFWQRETTRHAMKHRWVYLIALCDGGIVLCAAITSVGPRRLR
jgi:hypothetical protein